MMSSDLIVYQPQGDGLALAGVAGRDIDGMIAAWLHSKAARSGSERTATAYQGELTGFRDFLRARPGVDLDAPADVVALAAQAWCGRPGRRGRPPADGEQPTASPATATFNQRRAILSSFYTYSTRLGLLPGSNPIARVEGRTVHQYATATAPEAGDVKRNLAAIDREQVAGRRDYALLAVALATGRRLAELAALSWGDLAIQHTGRGEQLHVTWQRAKGGKVMRDVLAVPVSAALLTWLHSYYGASIGTLPATAPVWVSLAARNGTAGHRLSKQGIADVVKARLHTHPHATRHAFARATEQAGAKVSDVQARLGHSSLATTGKYLAALASADNPFADAVGAMFGLD